ncbi:MAG: hypothetical protein KAS90_01030 [Candidatus Aenigmarchaeota archaeon]|nr:hypothetical protein [Candidatus Aenigmarchaeota archaeon]
MSLSEIMGDLGNTARGLYNEAKQEINLHPKESIASGLIAAGLVGAVSFVQTKNPDDLESIFRAVPKAFQLYTPEMINHSMNAFDSVSKGLSESGVSQDLIKDEGISGLKEFIHLACAGLIKGAGYYGGETPSVTRKEINVPENTAEEEKVEQNAEEEKKGHGLLYVGIGTFGTIGIAILGYLYTQTTGESTGTPPQSTGTNPVFDPIIPVETDTPDHTPEATATAEPTQEPTAEPTATQETHWYDDKPYFNYGVIEANENLFGEDIEGVINEEARKLGRYSVFNENEQVIFKHVEYPNFDIYGELQPGQARELEEQYGSMVSLTMEQIDTDGGGMDKVAVRYEGSKGTWTDTFHFDKRADAGAYITAYISPEIYPSLIID